MFPTRRITTGGGDVFRDEFSLAFDGTNDFVDCGNVLDQGSGDFSISAWFKADTDIAQYDVLCAKRNSDGTGFVMDVRGTDPYVIGFAMRDDSLATRTLTGNTSITLDTWNHFIVVVDRTGTNKIHGYLNGVLDISPTGMTTLGSISNTESFGIGARISSGSISNKFVGNISEIALYNKALSASEVKTLYNGREPYNHKEGVCSSNLQAWWRMGDGVLDGIANYTGNNNDHPQVNIISDETDLTLGSELYTPANSLSNNEADDQSTGLTVMSGATVADETSIVSSGSSRSLKYTATGSTDGIVIDLTSDIDLTEGKVYKLSIDARHIGTGGDNSIRLAEAAGLSATGDTLAIATLTSSDTTFQTYTAYFIHNDTTTRYFGARETSGSDDGGLYLDNLSIKELNGNAGIMQNMALNSFKGDTP